MTTQHVLYIPITFLLGVVFGTMLPQPAQGISNSDTYVIRKRLFQSFLIFILVFIGTHVFEIPGGAKSVVRHLGGAELFDRSPSFSALEVYERLESFSDYGLTVYKRFTYTVDILFPLTLLFFLFNFARYAVDRIALSKLKSRIVMYLPFVWFASDMVENSIIFSLLFILPSQNFFLASALGIITAAKFILIVLSILTPTILLIGNLLFKIDLRRRAFK